MSTEDNLEETLTGIRITGDWGDVVEVGERMSAAIRRSLKRQELEGKPVADKYEWLTEFEDWRPKADEKPTAISEKTAEQASVSENQSEVEGKTVREDVEDAQSEMKDAVDSATELDSDTTKQNVSESIEHTQRATDSFFRKAIRWVEERVYKHIMTIISPYYFDNDLVNANLTSHRDNTYTLEVNISDDELYSLVTDELAQLEDETSVWRVETEVNEEPLQDVEGAGEEVPDTKTKERVENSVAEGTQNTNE